MQLRVRKEVGTYDTVNARQFEHWQTDLPRMQGGIIEDPKMGGASGLSYYDMAPLSSRTDKRDYRQAQPFIPTGPSLAENPYFDRYDPTRDPRNMIREMRAAVYEDKEGDRGIFESQKMVTRGYMNRWIAPGTDVSKEVEATLLAYSVMRPKIDDPGALYRGQAPPAEPLGLPVSIAPAPAPAPTGP